MIVTVPTFTNVTSPVVEFTVAIEVSLEEYTIGNPEILGRPCKYIRRSSKSFLSDYLSH